MGGGIQMSEKLTSKVFDFIFSLGLKHQDLILSTLFVSCYINYYFMVLQLTKRFVSCNSKFLVEYWRCVLEIFLSSIQR